MVGSSPKNPLFSPKNPLLRGKGAKRTSVNKYESHMPNLFGVRLSADTKSRLADKALSNVALAGLELEDIEVSGIADEIDSKTDAVTCLTEIDLYIAAIAKSAPPKMRKTAAEGIRAILEMSQAGDMRPIAELIARAKGEVTALEPRANALPPDTPPPVSPSRRHVADLTPAELEARRVKETARVARWRAAKRLAKAQNA